MDIILIAGLWLDAYVWDGVAAELRGHGHRPELLALPGVADRSTTATLDDQVAAAVAAVDRADRPMVVGHSAASGLAWMVADRRPDAIDRVVMVGGFPGADGEAYADFFETVDGEALSEANKVWKRRNAVVHASWMICPSLLGGTCHIAASKDGEVREDEYHVVRSIRRRFERNVEHRYVEEIEELVQDFELVRQNLVDGLKRFDHNQFR